MQHFDRGLQKHHKQHLICSVVVRFSQHSPFEYTLCLAESQDKFLLGKENLPEKLQMTEQGQSSIYSISTDTVSL